MPAEIKVHYRACHICEAICGLRIETQGDQVISIRADAEDPVSRGHICPEGVAIEDLHEDPDRLRAPVKRTDAGWQTISWDEALSTVVEKLGDIRDKHGPDAIGTYLGNPCGHNAGLMTVPGIFTRAIGTRNNFNTGSVDTWPTQLVCYLMYGHQFFNPVPDIDRTRYMVIIGGNPMVSNGSIMSAPDFPGRITELKERGKLVVVDPRRTETSRKASEHHFIRPGTDPWFLFAMIHVLFRDGCINLRHWEGQVDGLEAVREIAAGITPARAEAYCGVPAHEIERITHEFAGSDGAVMYGRIGTCAQDFGSIAQWAIQLINLLTGNLDREGGALITTPAMDLIQRPHGAGSHATFHTRVSGLPEFAGSLPAVAMAEEMLTPGEGQIRALINYAGNPLCGVSGTGEMEQALAGLDFMVAIDFYINESNTFANIILPPCSPLERGNFDLLYHAWGLRNAVRYSEAVFDKPADSKFDYEIVNELMVRWGARYGMEIRQLTPEMIVDTNLQANPEYPGFSLDKLRQHPHGIDLGPLNPSQARRMAERGHRLNAAPQVLRDDVPAWCEQPQPDPTQLVMIGRRHLRANNSWMNNFSRLTRGKPHNQLLMNPADMAARGIVDRSNVRIRNDNGELVVPVVASEDMMPGVVSLPHGWGQSSHAGIGLRQAASVPGANPNFLTTSKRYDATSCNTVFSGILVQVEAC